MSKGPGRIERAIRELSRYASRPRLSSLMNWWNIASRMSRRSAQASGVVLRAA